MRTSFFLATLLFSMLSQAQQLKKGDESLYLIQDGQVMAARTIPPKCSPGRGQCNYKVLVDVDLGLNGCADRLGPVTAKAVFKGGELTGLEMTAVGITNEMSKRARCNRRQTESVQVEIQVPSKGTPNLENLKLNLLDAGNIQSSLQR